MHYHQVLDIRILLNSFFKNGRSDKRSAVFHIKKDRVGIHISHNFSGSCEGHCRNKDLVTRLYTQCIQSKVKGSGTAVNCTGITRSEEHTSELQSRENLVCSLLLEEKKHARGGER